MIDEYKAPFETIPVSENDPSESGAWSPKKIFSKKTNPLIAGLIILFLIIALPAALFLSQRSQDIRQRAQTYCIPLDSFCGPGTSGNCCDGFCDNNTCKFCTANLQCTSGSEACCPGSNRVADSTCSGGFRCLPSSQACTSAPDGSNCTGKLPGQSCTRSGIGGTCGIVSGSESTCTCVVPTENTCESNGGTCYFGYTDCANLNLVNAPPSMTCPQNPGSPLFNLCCIANSGCSCTKTTGACGAAGGCPTGSRLETTTCSPSSSSCQNSSRCVVDPTCAPAGVCDGGCTWKADNTCNVGTCLGSCIRRTQYCESNTNPGVNCQPDQCASDNTCSASCVNASPPATPPATPPASPNASPSPIAMCSAAKIYRLVVNSTTCPVADPADVDCWVVQNAANPMAIGPGSVIYISTLGTVANGPTITQARIQVALDGAAFAPWNQATHGTTAVKPGSNPQEYYIAYTIPATATSATTFRIGAEVYSPQFDTNANAWDANNGWR